MSKYNKTVLTNAGIDLAKKVNAGRTKFSITKTATSSENLSDKSIADLQNMTELPSVMQYGVITDVEDSTLDKDTVIGMDLKFNNKELVHGYSVNTIGLYAKEDGGDEFLYAVATAIDPEHMPDFNNKAMFQFNVTIYVVVGQSSSVTINVTEEGVAAKKYVDNELNKKVDKTTYDKDKQQLEDGIKDAGKVDSVNLIKPNPNSKDVSLTSENIPHYNSTVEKTLDSLNNGKASKQDVTDAKQYADSAAKAALSNAEQYANEKFSQVPKTDLSDYYNKQETDKQITDAVKITSVNGGTGDVKVGGTNLFIKSTLQHGWLDHNQTDNGGISNSEADYHTDYIYVVGKENFILAFFQPSDYLKDHYFNAQIDLCDSNKAWLASISTWAGNWIVNDDKIYLPFSTVPNTVYIRVSVNYGNDDEMLNSHTKLEYGTVLTDWAPAPEDMVADKDFRQFKQDNQNALNGKATPNDVTQAESRANAHAENVAGTALSNAKNYTSSQLANYYNKQQTDTALNQKAPSTVDGHDVVHLLHNFVNLWGGDAEREPQINGNSTHFFDQVELVGRVLTTSGFFATDSTNFTFPIRKDDGTYSNEQLATALKIISEYAFSNKKYTDEQIAKIPPFSPNLMSTTDSDWTTALYMPFDIDHVRLTKGKYSFSVEMDNTKGTEDAYAIVTIYNLNNNSVIKKYEASHVAKGTISYSMVNGFEGEYNSYASVDFAPRNENARARWPKVAAWIAPDIPPNMQQYSNGQYIITEEDINEITSNIKDLQNKITSLESKIK